MQTEILNSRRLRGVDFARGLAVLFMVLVHVLEIYGSPSVASSVFGEVILFLGGPPAAPIFMLLMGISFSYSKKKDLKSGIVRGIKVLISGYILNVLRGVIPLYIAQLSGIPLGDEELSKPDSLLTMFLAGDILQFAGLTLIIMAILRHFSINRYILIGTAFIISMASPFLWKITVDIPIIGQFIDLLWGDKPIKGFLENITVFPVFPWLAFPLIGMVIGEIFVKSSDLSKSYRRIGITGAVIMVIGLVITATNPTLHNNDYYHSRQGGMIFMSGFTLLWLYLCHILTEKVKINPAFNLLYGWSKDVTSIYFIQWLIISWGVALFGINESSLITTIALSIIMVVLSHYINKLYQHIRAKSKE